MGLAVFLIDRGKATLKETSLFGKKRKMCMGHGSSPLTSRAAASCTGRLLSTNHESGRRIIYFSFRMNFSLLQISI